MATMDDVLDALVSTTQAALAGQTEPFYVYKGWPVREALKADLAAGKTHVSVYSPGSGTKIDMKPPIASQIVTVVPICLLGAELSASTLLGGAVGTAASGTVTFTGSVVAGTLGILIIDGQPLAFTPAAGAAVDVVASNLATLINADVTLSQLVTAAAAGVTITVTAVNAGVSGNAISLDLKLGGTGTVEWVIRQQTGPFQIHVWAPNDPIRALLGNAIDNYFANMNFLETVDLRGSRLTYAKTMQDDSEITEGIYRRMLFYEVQYDTTDSADAVQVLDGQVTITGSN